MQQTQLIATQEENHPESVPLQSQEQINDPPGLLLTTAENRRSSTPIQSDEEEVQEADLSALESAWRVIEASVSQLPELRNKNDSDQVDDGHASNQQQPGLEVERPSSQDTTLHEMGEQAQKDLGEGHSKLKKKKGNKKLSRRGVPMREEFFSKIGWTRSFISGPADPLHNPHMVWCHICKKNFSIKSKGPYEILRHHRTDRHLRRDQRWRYEHLRSVDPVSGKVQHRVRGANGKILTKIELANQLPKFINAELVDIGERFPFYEDFIRGTTTALDTGS